MRNLHINAVNLELTHVLCYEDVCIFDNILSKIWAIFIKFS